MGKVTLENIVHIIRDRMAYALEFNEDRLLSEIATTFGVIEEASYGTNNKDILTITGELEGWARDFGIVRVTAANLPSHEKISNVFKEVADSANSRFTEAKDNYVKILDLEHILHTLRDQIEKALKSDERRLLERLATALTIMREASDERRLLGRLATALTIMREAVDKIGDKRTEFIIWTLWYVAREGYLGFNIKDRLPSHAKITEVFE